MPHSKPVVTVPATTKHPRAARGRQPGLVCGSGSRHSPSAKSRTGPSSETRVVCLADSHTAVSLEAGRGSQGQEPQAAGWPSEDRVSPGPSPAYSGVTSVCPLRWHLSLYLEPFALSIGEEGG